MIDYSMVHTSIHDVIVQRNSINISRSERINGILTEISLDLLATMNNNKLDIKSLNKVSSEDVTNTLIKIKGIGKWTINNYKIFALQDVNAWPTADLALQESVKIIKKLKKRPNEIEME